MRTLLTIVTILALLLPACGRSAEVKVETGRLALQNRQFEDALRLAEEVLADDPQHQNAARLAAEAEIRLGRLDQAKTRIDQLLARDDADGVDRRLVIGWALNLASVLQGRSDFLADDDAQARMMRAIEEGRRAADWLITENDRPGDAYLDRSRLFEAELGKVDLMIRLQESSVEVQLARSETGRVPASLEARYRQRDELLREAISELRQALRVDPDLVAANRRLMTLLERDGQWSELWVFSGELAERNQLAVTVAVDAGNMLRRMPEGVQSVADRQNRMETLLLKVPENQRRQRDWQVVMAGLRGSEGKYSAMAEHAREALQIASQDNEARFLLARALVEQEQFAEARTQLDQITNNNFSNFYLLYGRIRQAQGDMSGARQDFSTARNLDPNNVEARRLWTAAMTAMGQADLVRTEIEAFYNRRPADPVAINEWMNILVRENNQFQIEQVLRSVEALDPLTTQHMDILARGHAALGDAEKSLEFARRRVRQFPNDLESHVSLAGILLAQGREDESRQALVSARERFPDAPAVDQLFARLHIQAGRFDRGIDLLAEVLDAEPRNVAARVLRAQALVALALLEEAEVEARSVLDIEPENFQAHAMLSGIYEQTGRIDQAAEHLARIDENRVDARRQPGIAARLAYRKGDEERAYQIAAEAVSTGFRDPTLWLLLAEIAVRNERLDEAQRHLTQMIEEFPENPASYRSFIRFFQLVPQAGGLPRAAEILGQLRSRMDNHPNIAYAEAQLTAALGRREAAIEAALDLLDRIVPSNPRLAVDVATFAAGLHLAQGRREQAIGMFDRLRRAGIEPEASRLRQIEIAAGTMSPEQAIGELAAFAGGLLADQPMVRRRAVGQIIRLGGHEQAINLLSRWSAAEPEEAAWYELLAAAHSGAGNVDQTISVLRRGVEALPENVRLRAVLAMAYMSDHRHPEAEKVYRALTELDRGAAIAGLAAWGEMLINLGLTREAIRVFGEMESFGRTRDPRVLFAMGRALYRLQRDEQALDRLGGIPGYAPQYAAAQLLMSRIEQRMGRPSEAQARLERLIQDRRFSNAATTELLALRLSDPDSFGQLTEWVDRGLELENLTAGTRQRWLELRVSLADRQQQWADAERALASIAQSSGEPSVTVDAARMLLLFQQGRGTTARSMFEERPHLRNSPLAPGLARLAGLPVSGEASDADPFFVFLDRLAANDLEGAEQALGQLPSNRFIFRSDLREMLGREVTNEERRRRTALNTIAARIALDVRLAGLAEHLAQSAAELEPGNVLAYAIWGSALAAKGASQDDLIRLIRSRLPGSGLAMVLQADRARTEGRHAEAAQWLGRAVEREPTQIGLKYEQSQQLRLAGEIDASIELLRALASDGPFQAAATNDLAYMIAEHRPDQLEEARAMAEALLDRFPDQPALVDTVAWIRHLKGEHEEALRMLQSVAIPLADQTEALFHLGAAYLKTGNKRWAEFYLDEVMHSDHADLARRAGQLLGRELSER